MSSVYHDGERFIQEQMGVRDKSDSLSSMIHKDMPIVAAQFLSTLNFCVISFSTNEKKISNSVVFGFDSFIEILNSNEIIIDLKKSTYIPQDIKDAQNLNIGFLGLEFENRMRMRINGKGKIKNNKLHLKIDEVYSNCPRYINDRKIIGEINFSEKSNICTYSVLGDEAKKIITNADTFFLSSNHEKGSDISHKGGKKGFLKVVSSSVLEFDDFPGNNMYNTLGNIHTNPNISIILINFTNNDILHINALANIKEEIQNKKKKLKVEIECTNITIESNNFSLKYDK